MNKNILIALVAIIVLAGGFVLVKNSNKQTATVTPTVTVQNPTTAPTAMEASPSVAMSASGTPSAMMEKEADVNLTADGFVPASVTIKKGEKVVWTNKSGDTATVDSDNHPTHLLYPPLNLGAFQDGEKHELVFDKSGTYTYHDHFHPSRRGTVVV
ncbi:MAG TPA: cupredoxin domain-containing protein, partial [Candidatus Saccharimonadales bacterium]|nr:cupredoxin domain-containing protein [Candidatus Saccharimonadales bacterium]